MAQAENPIEHAFHLMKIKLKVEKTHKPAATIGGLMMFNSIIFRLFDYF